MFGKLVVIAALAATLASAQRGGGGGGRNNNTMGTDMPMRTQRQSAFDQFRDKLKLNKDQESQARDILVAAAQQASPLASQMEKSRADLAGAMIDGKSDDEIKKLVEAQSAVQAQLDGVEADAFAKIFATLKPNQQSKAGQAFELMAGMFDRAAAGGGRRGERR